MKIETKPTENHEVILTIEVESEEFERAKRGAAHKLAKRVKIPGFRPGKAPYHVVARAVGEESIIEEAIETLANDLYPKALDETDIEPAAPGSLSEIQQSDPLVMEFNVPLMPEVTLGDYKSIRMPYESPTIPDEEVNDFLESLRNSRTIVTTVPRPAQEGDVVHITIDAAYADAPEDEEDEPAALMQNRHLAIQINAEPEDNEQIFPGFSAHLVGMSAGETKEVQYTYPEDYEDETYKGRTVNFKFEVTKVTEHELPELDDEFAQSLGEFENYEELVAAVREMMEKDANEKYDQEYKNQVVTTLVEQSEVKYPPVLLENSLEDVRTDFERTLARQGLNTDLYLDITGTSKEDFEKQMRETAEERLLRSLVIEKFIATENIEADEDAVQAQALHILDQLSQDMPEKEFRKFMKDASNVSSVVSAAFTDVLTSKAIDHLKAIAQGKGEESAEEAEMAAESDEETAEEITEAVSEEPPIEESVAEESAETEASENEA